MYLDNLTAATHARASATRAVKSGSVAGNYNARRVSSRFLCLFCSVTRKNKLLVLLPLPKERNVADIR